MSRNETFAARTQEQRVEHWISQLEAQTELLLSEIEIEEISHKERLNLALKMMSQLQHFLALQQKTNVSPPASNNLNSMLENLMRQMRGEDDDVHSSDLPIVYSEATRIADEDEGNDEDEDEDEESC